MHGKGYGVQRWRGGHFAIVIIAAVWIGAVVDMDKWMFSPILR